MAIHVFFVRGLFLLIGLYASAWAQFGTPLTQAIVSTPQVRAELVAHAPYGVQAGKTFWIGLQLQHAPEWHTYWRNPGDAGLPTELSFTLPEDLQVSAVLWPLPEKIAVGKHTNYGFEKDVLLAVAVTVAPTYRAPIFRQLVVQLRANWLACRLECIRQEGEFLLKLPTQGSFVSHTSAFGWLLAQQPTKLSTAQKPAKFEGAFLVSTLQGLPTKWVGEKVSVFPLNPELLESSTNQHSKASQHWQGNVLSVRLPVSTSRKESPQEISWLLVSGEGLFRQGVEVAVPVAGGWPASSAHAFPRAEGTQSRTPTAVVSSGPWIFSLALVGALLGGLVLNAIPCALPIFGIKFLGFTHNNASPYFLRLSSVAYTLGVVAIFLAIGWGIMFTRFTDEGWVAQLQSPPVVATLALLLTLIALNLWGVLTMGKVLPSNMASFQARFPVGDVLLSGVLTMVVASTFMVPMMVATFGLANSMPAWQTLCIFAGMGLGLALPYLLASWVPAISRAMPKTGPWIVTMRHALAFPVLATAVCLLWVFGLQTSVTQTIVLLGGLLVAALAVWLGPFRTTLARGVQVACLACLCWIGMELFSRPSPMQMDASRMAAR